MHYPKILINGLQGDDWVILSASFQAAVFAGANLVPRLEVWGKEGNDIFHAPQGKVILPTGAEPNILFNGGENNDEFIGLGDPEKFVGESGMDIANAGGGKDILEGGDDDDRLNGDDNDDHIFGGGGADTLNGGNDDDEIRGDGGPDSIHGNAGIDAIEGGAGVDWIFGDENDDVIYGMGDDDVILGGDGDDVIDPGLGYDRVTGGPGDDTIVDVGNTDGNELLHGGPGTDHIYGSDGPDVIEGGIGPERDFLYGNGDDDVISGDGGDDLLVGGAGNDSMHGGLGSDTIWSGDFGADQPYNGVAPPGVNPAWNDVRGMGEQDCDLEDGHEDLDPGCTCSEEEPTVVDDEYHTQTGQTLNVPAPGVLANDTGPGPLTAVLHTGPSAGSVTLNADGSFTYVPQFSTSSDQFTYTTTSGCHSHHAVVTIIFDNYGCSCLTLDVSEHHGEAEALAISQLLVMSDAAIARWRAAGVSREALLNQLDTLSFEIVDLPGSALGAAASNGRVLIDIDAAGHGWFIDATPGDDAEFRRIVSASQKEATGGAAADGADLLTVLVHEIGHVLGLHHAFAERTGDTTNVMNDTIGLGTRRNPTAWDAAIVEYLYWTSQRRR